MTQTKQFEQITFPLIAGLWNNDCGYLSRKFPRNHKHAGVNQAICEFVGVSPDFFYSRCFSSYVLSTTCPGDFRIFWIVLNSFHWFIYHVFWTCYAFFWNIWKELIDRYSCTFPCFSVYFRRETESSFITMVVKGGKLEWNAMCSVGSGPTEYCATPEGPRALGQWHGGVSPATVHGQREHLRISAGRRLGWHCYGRLKRNRS